ncbi:hypothetical protein CDAR_449011 [Caerostris darwini]|uniref:Uncharacterized protein n=1 Tax=Caerostris darwini TaxID=1538125 RepID=A0AAV4THN4_9ARAC|nr:hypothetical protein CDAR_449011 [Caerostris darwini]
MRIYIVAIPWILYHCYALSSIPAKPRLYPDSMQTFRYSLSWSLPHEEISTKTINYYESLRAYHFEQIFVIVVCIFHHYELYEQVEACL